MGKLTNEDIILKNQIAGRIKFFRLRTGLSQSEFAQKFDIDRQILSRWESKNNSRGVTIYTIQKFCSMIGITLKEFFDFEWNNHNSFSFLNMTIFLTEEIFRSWNCRLYRAIYIRLEVSKLCLTLIWLNLQSWNQGFKAGGKKEYRKVSSWFYVWTYR